MRQYWLWPSHKVKMPHTLCEHNILRSHWRLIGTSQEMMREANLEVISRLNLIDVILRQAEAQSFDITFQMGCLATTYYWEDIRR